MRVSEHAPAVERPLAEVRAEATAAARLHLAQQQAIEKARTMAAELQAGAPWESVTRSWIQAGVNSHQPQMRRRDDAAIPQAVRDGAFKSAWPDSGARYGSAVLANGDAGVWRLSAVRAGTLGLLVGDALKEKANEARDRIAYQDSASYILALRERADVDVNPNLFE